VLALYLQTTLEAAALQDAAPAGFEEKGGYAA
jgi:hypothetical protein